MVNAPTPLLCASLSTSCLRRSAAPNCTADIKQRYGRQRDDLSHAIPTRPRQRLAETPEILRISVQLYNATLFRGSWMSQLTFSNLDYGFKRKQTRRELFLTEMVWAPIRDLAGVDSGSDPYARQMCVRILIVLHQCWRTRKSAHAADMAQFWIGARSSRVLPATTSG
jgi:hypothetical protein